MAKIIVLGGCGAVGNIAVKTLASFTDFQEILIGDVNKTRAHEIIAEIGSDYVSFIEINALNTNDLRDIIKDFDVILNCIGPFYKYGPIVLQAAIEAKRNYVDINDDVDATQKVLNMHEQAKKANISALIGMGSSPGVTNILAKFASETLLDEVESIDIYHAHGGEPFEGPGVIYHRIHSMCIDIPVYINGQFKTVRFFDNDGRALEEEINFHKIGKYRVHPYPHPETITLPKYIKGIKQVTNKGTVLPPKYFYLITELVKLGMNDNTPLKTENCEISPLEFSIAYIVNARDKILKESNFGSQKGCLKIVTTGKKEGKFHQYVFSLASEEQAMGEGTGIPAAIGAILMQRGLIKEKGVLPPEACVQPLEFLNVMQEHLNLDSAVGGKSPLKIESVDAEGNIKSITL